jgi:hypothetical protein
MSRGSISDLQATATASVLGNVKRADINYNLRMAPPVPTNTNPRATAGRVNNLRNGLPGENRAQPNQTGISAPLIPTPPLRRQFNSTTGVMGGGAGSDLPIAP